MLVLLLLAVASLPVSFETLLWVLNIRTDELDANES